MIPSSIAQLLKDMSAGKDPPRFNILKSMPWARAAVAMAKELGLSVKDGMSGYYISRKNHD